MILALFPLDHAQQLVFHSPSFEAEQSIVLGHSGFTKTIGVQIPEMLLWHIYHYYNYNHRGKATSGVFGHCFIITQTRCFPLISLCCLR